MTSLSIAMLVPGQRRARVVVAAAVIAGALVGAGDAVAARQATVCSAAATLFETPGGAKVGIVHRGDRLRVAAVGADDGWWRVVTRFGTRGWIREAAICRRDR